MFSASRIMFSSTDAKFTKAETKVAKSSLKSLTRGLKSLITSAFLDRPAYVKPPCAGMGDTHKAPRPGEGRD